jgi:hypothetical protein
VTIRMPYSSIARCRHGVVVGHMHGKGAPRWLHAPIGIVSRFVEWERSSHTTLLHLVNLILSRARLVHMQRRWRHVLASRSGHKLQMREEKLVGEIIRFLCICIYVCLCDLGICT